VLELLVAFVVVAVVGWLRPRRSSLWVAAVPGALAFAWLLMHEDILGERVGLADVARYLGMGVVVGVAFSVACGLGVVARRQSGRPREVQG
jgi:hypothetical protein